jgi:hypothetical protein
MKKFLGRGGLRIFSINPLKIRETPKFIKIWNLFSKLGRIAGLSIFLGVMAKIY